MEGVRFANDRPFDTDSVASRSEYRDLAERGSLAQAIDRACYERPAAAVRRCAPVFRQSLNGVYG